MYRRYYDGYARVNPENDSGEVFVPHARGDTYADNHETNNVSKNESSEITAYGQKNKSLLAGLEADDLILIGVLIFLLLNGDGEDPLMPIIIGFILISELL
ncbi:MAG: hypothetical protein E7394_03660 [Ruminococcaceae bacterium]|nr:hypothetical protein [Oscillospiraceae bacterium]